jgi:DUF1009 family protein
MGASADKNKPRLAIISGRGDLPRLLAEECHATGRAYVVVEFKNIPLGWASTHPVIPAIFEQTGHLFEQLQKANCHDVVMAGSMDRESFDVDKLDEKGIELATILSKTMKAGDDETLSSIIRFFEVNGFNVHAAHEVLLSLIPAAGVLTNVKPSEDDIFDATRAAEIVNGLGRIDVGQGAVVGQGICLGLESIQGTDTMLNFVKNNRNGFSPNPNGGRGVLLKAPKPDQDLRVDLPTIGPDTIRNAHKAGLAGVVIEAGGVMILRHAETVTLANELEVFLWVRPKK